MVDVNDVIELKYMEQTMVHGTIVEITDGKAYIDIPATRVVMTVKQSLVPVTPEAPEVEHQFAGIEQPKDDGGSVAREQVTSASSITSSNESLRTQNLDSSALDD